MINLRRPRKPKRYRHKRTIQDLPMEILLMIFQSFFENVCRTSQPFPVGVRADLKWKDCERCSLTDLVSKARALPRDDPAWGLHNCDFTIADIARVCKSWRDIVMSLTFKQDIRAWDWYDHQEKFRLFQYIETKVYRYQRQTVLNDQAYAEEEAREANGEAAAQRAARAAKTRR